MNRNLFVYGTLRLGVTSRMGGEQRARLTGEARLLGPATIRGRLYDLGRYPGLVDSDDPADVVHGEVVELADPGLSLPWLDAYEGIKPGGGTDDEYTREERAVLLAPSEGPGEPRKMTAWVYVYAWDLSRARRVLSGNWGE